MANLTAEEKLALIEQYTEKMIEANQKEKRSLERQYGDDIRWYWIWAICVHHDDREDDPSADAPSDVRAVCDFLFSEENLAELKQEDQRLDELVKKNGASL